MFTLSSQVRILFLLHVQFMRFNEFFLLSLINHIVKLRETRNRNGVFTDILITVCLRQTEPNQTAREQFNLYTYARYVKHARALVRIHLFIGNEQHTI